MRILHVSEYRGGNGAAVAAQRLTHGLVRAGCTVELLYLYTGPGDPPEGIATRDLEDSRSALHKLAGRLRFRLHERLSMSRLPPIREWSARRLLSPHYLSNARALRAETRRFRADVIHLHNISLLTGHEDVARLSREVPVVWSMHDCHAARGYAYRYEIGDDLVRTDPPTRLLRSSRTPRRWFRRAGTVALVSPSRWLAEEAPLHGPPVTVIPYGVPTGDFHPVPKGDARRALRVAEDGRLKVLAVATDLMHPRKNMAVVLAAMDSLAGAPVELLLLGRADEDLRRAFPEATFLGYAADAERLRLAYSAADVTVIPSLVDNLPNAAIESLMCGTPVVGANTGGIPDIVIPGETGWQFDPRDSGALAALLERLAGARREVAALSESSARIAARRYSMEAQAVAMMELYRTVTQRHQSTGLPPAPASR